MEINKLMKPELKEFIPYNANQIPYRVKLDANESPFGLPESVKRMLYDYISGGLALNIYPDTDITGLRKLLAKTWGVRESQIIAGNGSDEIIEMLVHAFVGKGDVVVCPTPSFGMYKITTIIGGGKACEVNIHHGDEFAYRPQSFIETANTCNAKLVFLCTPNNPTGNIIPGEDIVEIIKGCSNSIIVMDEAYAEFSGKTLINEIDKYPNVVVLRTFSKAYGLAGIRCGYGIASEEIIDILNRVRPPYNLNTLSQLIAGFILEEDAENRARVEYIIEQRKALEQKLREIPGVRVYPSQANFILIRVKNSGQVYKRLVDAGVLVRAFGGGAALEDCLRISVGILEQNDECVMIIKQRSCN